LEDSVTTGNDADPVRRRLRFSKSMMPLFAGLAAALLALALVIGSTTLAQREARARAMNEGDMLLALNEVLTATLDGETGQRGYLLTGRPDYLTPYTDAEKRCSRAMAGLRAKAATVDDPALPIELARLDAMTTTKFGEMDRSVALAQAGFKDQALALVQADFGKLEMDAIRSEIVKLRDAGVTRRRAAFDRAASLERRLLPLIGVLGLAILALVYAGIRAERRRSLTEAEAGQAAALRDANARIELLARELNHRVKNLFSVILAIVSLSGRKEASSREVVDDIRARIRALSLAHSASQGGHGDAGIALGPLIARTMEPYAEDDGGRVRVNGPEVELPQQMVTPIGMIIHELATNAVKYGALSVDSGTVEIRWEIAAPTDGAASLLVLSWTETGGPPIVPETAANRVGFGSQMTNIAAGQLGGTIERDWPVTGAIVRLKFPPP
jgi:two-component sensor histidine kinase